MEQAEGLRLDGGWAELAGARPHEALERKKATGVSLHRLADRRAARVLERESRSADARRRSERDPDRFLSVRSLRCNPGEQRLVGTGHALLEPRHDADACRDQRAEWCRNPIDQGAHADRASCQGAGTARPDEGAADRTPRHSQDDVARDRKPGTGLNRRQQPWQRGRPKREPRDDPVSGDAGDERTKPRRRRDGRRHASQRAQLRRGAPRRRRADEETLVTRRFSGHDERPDRGRRPVEGTDRKPRLGRVAGRGGSTRRGAPARRTRVQRRRDRISRSRSRRGRSHRRRSG